MEYFNITPTNEVWLLYSILHYTEGNNIGYLKQRSGPEETRNMTCIWLKTTVAAIV